MVDTETSITLDSELYEALEERSQTVNYDDVDEYISEVLHLLIEQLNSDSHIAEQTTSTDDHEETVKNRLSELGYM